MKPTSQVLVFAATLVALLSACGNPVCDRAAKVDVSMKVGSCTISVEPTLGAKDTCASRIGPCPQADQDALGNTIDCLEKLPSCTPDTQQFWENSRASCYSRFSSLSAACVNSLKVTPPVFDAGTPPDPDAGPRPLDDGKNGVELVVVANETQFAFAWTTLQANTTASWMIVDKDDGGHQIERSVEPGTAIDFLAPDDAGLVSGRFHLVGYDVDHAVAHGLLDGGTPVVVDAGNVPQCNKSFDCDVDRVCDLNQCKVQTCQPGNPNSTCPAGYTCGGGATCQRMGSDGGLVIPVKPDAGMQTAPLVMVSNSMWATLGTPQFSMATNVGGFTARRLDVVGFDTARVFVSAEQEGNAIGHPSFRRGRDFPDDALTTTAIDSLGTRIHVTYNRDNKVLFACYTVGRAVRVRASNDFGQTWVNGAADIDPGEGDGGMLPTIGDCAIAPWKNGTAMVVTVDDDALKVRTVTSALSIASTDIAMISNTADGGIQTPSRPAIATSPADGIVHITFTANRYLSGGTIDPDVFSVYRDGTTGGFTQPLYLKPGFGAVAAGTPFKQDNTAVTIDPISKRAVAAYTSLEGSGTDNFNTVRVSMWFPASKSWGTGPDLDVLYKMTNTHLVVPTKRPEDKWDIFSPSLAVTPAGKMYLSVVGGKKDALGADYRMLIVPFDLDGVSPAGTGRGWFVPPAKEMSSIRVLDPRSGAGPAANVSAIAADAQLSIYGTFIEGLGNAGETGGRAQFVTYP